MNDSIDNASVVTYDVAIFHELCNREKVNLRLPFQKSKKHAVGLESQSNLDQIKENDYPPGFLTDNDDTVTPVIDECLINDNVINDPEPCLMHIDHIKSLHT